MRDRITVIVGAPPLTWRTVNVEGWPVERFDELTTERLLMRRWRQADREPFAAMNADPDVMRHFPSVLERAASDAFLDRLEARFDTQGFGLWALERRDTGDLIGFAGLNPMPPGVPHAGGMEVGWRLATSAWGQGFATEAGRAAVDLAFGPLGFDELWSMTAVSNLPSQRVMQRLGMTLSTHFEHPAVPEDSPVRPHVLYGLRKQETAHRS
jgi:RimJ/RimL family protein N-acetyltransferase